MPYLPEPDKLSPESYWLFQRSHIAVEFGDLGRFRQIGDRLVVIALRGRTGSHPLIAGRQILLRRLDAVQFGGIFRSHAFVDHLLEQLGSFGIVFDCNISAPLLYDATTPSCADTMHTAKRAATDKNSFFIFFCNSNFIKF